MHLGLYNSATGRLAVDLSRQPMERDTIHGFMKEIKHSIIAEYISPNFNSKQSSFWTRAYVEQFTKQPVISAGSPVYYGGSDLLGGISVDMSINKLTSLVNSDQNSTGWYFINYGDAFIQYLTKSIDSIPHPKLQIFPADGRSYSNLNLGYYGHKLEDGLSWENVLIEDEESSGIRNFKGFWYIESHVFGAPWSIVRRIAVGDIQSIVHQKMWPIYAAIMFFSLCLIGLFWVRWRQYRQLTMRIALNIIDSHHNIADQLKREFYLTTRQIEVLRVLSKGMQNDQIAHHLSIARATVSFHMKDLKTKLGCRTRGELVAKAATYFKSE